MGLKVWFGGLLFFGLFTWWVGCALRNFLVLVGTSLWVSVVRGWIYYLWIGISCCPFVIPVGGVVISCFVGWWFLGLRVVGSYFFDLLSCVM